MARALAWLCAFGLGACAVDPSSGAGSPGASLTGTRWNGVVDAALDHRAIPRLEFAAEGRLSGYTGCNMLTGKWRMEDGEVRLGALVTTKRLCLGPASETERRLLAAMGEGARGRREGDRLVLTGPNGARFEFREAAAA